MELTDIDKAKIISFNQDEAMSEAVKKVLLASIYSNGVIRKGKKINPLQNGALGLAFLALHGRAVITNEQLGEDLRALAQGVNLLETGFKELEKVKPKGQEEEKTNEAI